MALIVWTSEFELGLPEIDNEHRQLVEMINQVHSGIRRGARCEQVLAGLEEIYRSVSSHFAHEEEHMREVRYLSYAEHKEDHEILLDDLRDIIELVERNGDYPEGRLSRDLNFWFSEHFRTHDARLHSRHQG